VSDAHKGYKGDALAVLARFGTAVWDDVEIQSTRGRFRGIVLPSSMTRSTSSSSSRRDTTSASMCGRSKE